MPVKTKFRGPGNLEETGYIPKGSWKEREKQRASARRKNKQPKKAPPANYIVGGGMGWVSSLEPFSVTTELSEAAELPLQEAAAAADILRQHGNPVRMTKVGTVWIQPEAEPAAE